jgi:alpha-L-fucosidase
VNEASIRGTERTPLPVEAWGESTRKGGTLYLHVFDWPKSGQLIVGGLRSGVRRAYLLSDGKRTPLRVSLASAADPAIEVPPTAPDPVDTVIVVETAGGEIAADPNRLLSPAQVNTLRSFDGVLHGGVKYGAGKAENAYVENWTRNDASVSWPVRVTAPAQYEVSAVYDAPRESEGGTYRVQLGTQELSGTVRTGIHRVEPLGRIRLEPGRFEIRVLSKDMKGAELLRLRSLVLKPI